MEELGISCTTEGVGWDTAYDRALADPLLWGWGAHTPMELYNIYHTMEGTGTAQYSPYSNETVDTYMDQALASPDLESSYELWQKAQWDGAAGVTQEGDIPWVWLVNIDHLYWVRDGLQVAEQKVHPHGHGCPWSTMWTSGPGHRAERTDFLETPPSVCGEKNTAHGASSSGSQRGHISSHERFATGSSADQCGQVALGTMSQEQVEQLEAYWGVDTPPWRDT